LECKGIKEKFDFRLLVDDAHGFGTLAEDGSGTGIHQGVQDQIDLYFSTFAKSMASIGAFMAGDEMPIKFLKYNMRSQIFAKSVPHVILKGALKRLEIIRKEPQLVKDLWKNVNMLQSGLRENGFNLGNTNTCVTPVFLNGNVEEAMVMVKDLRENYRIFCSIVVYPVIPQGMILLRLIPTARHTKKDIDETIEAFKAVSAKLSSGMYNRS
jgi:glycine C-acetyltransferase